MQNPDPIPNFLKPNLPVKKVLRELFCAQFEKGGFMVRLFTLPYSADCGRLGSGKSLWCEDVLSVH